MPNLRTLFLGALLCLTALPAIGQDPVKTDPAYNKVEFENEQVRVLRIRLPASQKDTMHQHPASIAVTLTDQHIRATGPDGVSREFRRKAGEVQYLAPSVHTIENLSSSAYETILVEVKGAAAAKKE